MGSYSLLWNKPRSSNWHSLFSFFLLKFSHFLLSPPNFYLLLVLNNISRPVAVPALTLQLRLRTVECESITNATSKGFAPDKVNWTKKMDWCHAALCRVPSALSSPITG